MVVVATQVMVKMAMAVSPDDITERQSDILICTVTA